MQPGKQQYVNKKKPSEIATPDATAYPPGAYTCTSGWVNVRAEPDTTSDIIAQPKRDEVLQLTAVRTRPWVWPATWPANRPAS